jgi:cytochrome c553
LRALLVAEAGGARAVCGYSRCILNLHFHHVDPSQKSFSMSVARGKSEAACRAEMRKCVLVCANCHGEIESGLIQSPPAPG